MARHLRIDPIDGWHHVMNRGVDRRRIFVDDLDRIEFGKLVGLACDRFDVEVHAYCLMDNHFHLLVRCPNGGVSDFMQLLSGLYARFFNDRHGRVGHLFGSRFTSRTLTTPRYIANTARYIHRNVLDVSDVRSVDDYRWSSHRTYLGYRSCPSWLHLEPIMNWFGGAAAFDAFVTGSTSSPVDLGIATAAARRNAESRSRTFGRDHPETAALSGHVIELLGSSDHALASQMHDETAA